MSGYSATLIQLARRPVPGQAKTRLIPVLGPEGAAQLHTRLLQQTLKVLQEVDLGPVILLWDRPSSSLEGECGSVSLPAGITEGLQGSGDLGARMQGALRVPRSAPGPVLLVGSDCPVLTRDYLQRALDCLQTVPLVLGPAEDGGYVLIGLSGWLDGMESLFIDMPWGSDQVLALTCQRAEQAGIALALLPECWDVDRPEDLDRLARLPGFTDLEAWISEREWRRASRIGEGEIDPAR